jgi:hypothetical protein
VIESTWEGPLIGKTGDLAIEFDGPTNRLAMPRARSTLVPWGRTGATSRISQTASAKLPPARLPPAADWANPGKTSASDRGCVQRTHGQAESNRGSCSTILCPTSQYVLSPTSSLSSRGAHYLIPYLRLWPAGLCRGRTTRAALTSGGLPYSGRRAHARSTLPTRPSIGR